MKEYVKLNYGVTAETRMTQKNWHNYAVLVRMDEPPVGEGWYEVVKSEKPPAEVGKVLSWTYTLDGDKMRKSYAYIRPQRTFSKLRLYAAISAIGKWEELRSWMETQTYEGMNAWMAFSLAQDLVEDNKMFAEWLAAAKTVLEVDDATVEWVLDAAAIKQE